MVSAMFYARRIVWLVFAWTGALAAQGEEIRLSSERVPNVCPVNGAVRPSGLPALGGEIAGELHFRSGEWSVTGPLRIELATEGETDEASEVLVAVISFRAAELPLTELELSDLAVEAEIELPRNVARVRVAEFTALGGRVSLRPFEIDLGNAEAVSVVATAELHGLALDQLASFVPEAVREANGRVNGEVSLGWSEANGLQIGSGALRIEPTAQAQLRLTAMPGFLTQHTTPRFFWMPASFGRLARWLALDNPAYDTLAEIEEGTQPLHVESLHVALYPDGPDGPRSAAVSLVARPVSGAVVKQLRFDINVSGPLDQVLRLGVSDSVRLNFGGK